MAPEWQPSNNCAWALIHLQESAEDDAEVAAQLADMLNRLRPPDSPGRAGLTAANVGNVSIEEMTARIKVGRICYVCHRK